MAKTRGLIRSSEDVGLSLLDYRINYIIKMELSISPVDQSSVTGSQTKVGLKKAKCSLSFLLRQPL